MKAKFASLLVVLLLAATTQLSAQRNITVEAINDDISYYLDLKAVATVFGDARNLEDFERRLNDYDSQISNLDLNSDGEVDYLRVIETSERNVHLVVIQAVLDRDVYQDVATIAVDLDRYNRSYVQVIGDPYLYGYNYIIEPVYYRTPFIVSWFWTPRYSRWNSPYYWGYYPNYYRHYRPMEINIYMSHIHSHINQQHHYRYADNYRNQHTERLHNSISRNDYGQKHPDRNFNSRHTNVTNRAAFDKRNEGNNRGSKNSNNESGRRTGYENGNTNNRPNSGGRNEHGTRTDNGSRNPNNSSNGNVRTDAGRNNNSGTNNRGSNSGSNTNVNRGNNQNRPTTVTRPENRPTTVNRESNSRPTVNKESGNRNQNSTVVKPSRPSNESKGSERKPDVKPSTDNKKSDNRSSRGDSRR